MFTSRPWRYHKLLFPFLGSSFKLRDTQYFARNIFVQTIANRNWGFQQIFHCFVAHCTKISVNYHGSCFWNGMDWIKKNFIYHPHPVLEKNRQFTALQRTSRIYNIDIDVTFCKATTVTLCEAQKSSSFRCFYFLFIKIFEKKKLLEAG